jgi:hypothetical protein
MKVLIADDDCINRVAIGRLFEKRELPGRSQHLF